jgi:hypothetical protein
MQLYDHTLLVLDQNTLHTFYVPEYSHIKSRFLVHEPLHIRTLLTKSVRDGTGYVVSVAHYSSGISLRVVIPDFTDQFSLIYSNTHFCYSNDAFDVLALGFNGMSGEDI